jgi:hypothetical protein
MSKILDSILSHNPMQEVLDLETGLPKSQVALDKQREDLSKPIEPYGSSSPMSRGDDPTGVSRTDRVNEKLFKDAEIGSRQANWIGGPDSDLSTSGLHIGDDYEDFAAHQQHWSDKWANGLFKMAGKSVVNAIGGIGMIPTAIGGIAKWDFKSVYDNEFHNSLDDINEWMDGRLPNYAAKEEREMGFLQSMGRANFWAGDLFGNVVPFVLGAVLTEVALSAATAATFGGASAAQGAATVGILAKATSLLTGLGRAATAGGKLIGKGAKGRKAYQAFQAIRSSSAAAKAYQAGSLGRRVLTGAGYEAGVEARNHINVLKTEFTTDFIEENGRAPNAEEKADIQDRATQSANWVFTGNLALVGGGNMLQFPKIFMPGAGSLAKKPLGKILRESVTDPYKAAYKSWGKSRNIIDAGYHVLKNPVWEGIIEEGGQGWIDNAAHHNSAKYWAKKHNAGGIEYGIGMIDSLGKTFEESYGTKEAWKEIGMGMLIGGLGLPGYVKTGQKTKDGKDIRKFEMQGGAFEPMRKRAEKRARTDKLVDAINKNPSAYESLKHKFQNYSRAVDLQLDKDGALAENDMFTYKNAENDEFFSFISTRLEAGLFSDVIEDIKLVEEMSNEQFVEEFGYTDIVSEEGWSQEKIEARKTKVVESALAQAKKVKESTELIDKKFSGIEGWSQEELNKAMSQFGHHLPPGQQTVENLNKVIREQLIHSASTIESVDRRTEEVTAKLDEITGGALRKDLRTDSTEYNFLTDRNVRETFGARARAISKYLSENEKLADNDPAKLDEAGVAGLNQELGQLNAAIAAGLIDNSIDDALAMDAFRWSNPKEFAKKDVQEEVLGLLRDLRKLDARRQEFIGYYNGLFTKEGQQEALTQVEFFMDENDAKARAEQREEALKALREGNDRAFREATNGLEFKVESTNEDGNNTVGYYKWSPNSSVELFNVKNSLDKITIDDIRQQNEDGTSSLKEGVTILTPLQAEKRMIREAIARIKETAPEKIIETEKKVEELNAKIVDIAERLEKLNLTANTKDSKGRMRSPAGTIATEGKQKGKNIGGQLVKNTEVLDAIDEATLQIENITAQRDKLKFDLDLFREHAVMLDAMLKESGDGPIVSPFQRSLEQRVALENAIKEDGMRKVGVSGTTIPYNLDKDGKPLFAAEERLSDRYELTEKSEQSYYTTAEVLQQVSDMIAQQESNLEALIEKNEVLKEMILDDSFLSLMEQFQKDNPGSDPQDPAAFIAYTNQIIENGEESVTSDARKWKGKDRDYWKATAERHAKLLAAKPEAMADLYSRYAEVRDAKEQANLMLDEFYATEEKIENLKQNIQRDKVREARLTASEGRKAEGLNKVQRAVIFSTGYKILQDMLDNVSKEEAAQEALLTQIPTAQQPQANSSAGDIYMDEVYAETTTNEAGEEVQQASPTDIFEKGSNPKSQDGGADSNGQFKPDASDTGYGKTAGIDRADKDTNLDPVHMSPSQRTFYKFVDDLKGTFDTNKYRLRAVTVNNNPYPELTEDFVTKDPKTGKAIDDIMMIVVNKDGTPVKRGGEFVFTKMLLPNPSGDRFSGIGGETGITQEAWEASTNQYIKARQAVINSKDGLTFNITGSSIGMPNLQKEGGEFVQGSVVGRLTDRVENVNKIPLRVVTGESISENGVQYKFGVRRGMVYAIHKGRPVPMQLRTINDSEIETVMQILMGYGRGVYSGDPAVSSEANIIPGTENNTPVFSRLHDLIKFGQWKDKGNIHAPKYSIYLETKDNNKYIVFGGNRILLQSIDPTAQPSVDIAAVDGKAVETSTPIYSPENEQKLRDFLKTKIHNVSRPTLNSNKEYYDVSIDAEGTVREVPYANYREYLMKPRATLSDTPMSTSLVPMVERGNNGEGVNNTQFKFTYLKYDLGHYAKPAVVPVTPKAPVQQARPDGGTDLANLAGQAQNLSKAPQEVGIKSTDLEVDKTYNLVLTPVGKAPMRIEVSRQSDGTIVPRDLSQSPEVTRVLNVISPSLKVGTPFEVAMAALKAQAPAITADFMFEEVGQPIPAPISAEVKEQGQTVEEAVVKKSTQDVIPGEREEGTREVFIASPTSTVLEKYKVTYSPDLGGYTAGFTVWKVEENESDSFRLNPDTAEFETAIRAYEALDATQPASEGKASTQEIQYKNNTYVVDISNFTVTNKKTGKVIITTSPIGVAVMDQVDFDALEEPFTPPTDTDSDYRIPELGEDPNDSPFLLASRINEAEENTLSINSYANNTFKYILRDLGLSLDILKDEKYIEMVGKPYDGKTAVNKAIEFVKERGLEPTSENIIRAFRSSDFGTSNSAYFKIPDLDFNQIDKDTFIKYLRTNNYNGLQSLAKKYALTNEVAWFEEKFPFIPISTIPGLIEGVGYGQTIEAGRVILSQLAVEGTAYHEAFHVIEGKFISAEQKDAVYAAYSRLTGVKEDISEELAEEFRTYMLTDGKFPIGKGTRKDQTLIQKFFQAIKDFINLLLGKGPKKDQVLLQTLFKSIKNGTFSTPNPDAKFTGEAKQFKRLELADGTFLSVHQSRDFVETIAGNMFKVLFAGDVSDISMPDLLNLSSSQHSDLLAARVNELLNKSIIGYTNSLKALISNPNTTLKTKEKAITLLNTVGSQPNPFWSVLKQETFNWLKTYKVEMQPLADLQDESKKLKDSVSMVNANEVNVKQMAPAIVKLLMATLPAGTTRGSINTVLGEGLVDSRKFFNLVMQELAGTEAFSDQITKLKTLMATHPEFIKPITHLIVRLKGTEKWPAESLTPSEFQMQQQFRQQFHKAYSEDQLALVSEDGVIKIIRTNADRKNALMIEEFRGNLKVNIRDGKGPFKELPDGSISIDMGAKMNINGKQLTLEQYSAKPSRKDSLAFLDQFGITFDNAETLTDLDLSNIFTQLHGEGGTGIVSELVKLGVAGKSIEEFYSVDSGAFTRLKKIIDIQAARTTKTIDLQHQAADGKTNYSIILNNFASNIIGRLNSGKIPSYLLDKTGELLESVRGSLLLEGAMQGLQIGFGAISGLKIEGSRHGRVLEDVSPKRLFQIEFTSVLNGIIPMLRASEKKTEFSMNLKVADRNGNSIYQMMPNSNDAYADQMMKYLRMEIFKSKISAGNNIAGYREAKGELRLFEYLPIDLADIGGVADIDTFLEENKEELKAAIISRLDSRSESILNESIKNGVFSDFGRGQYKSKIEPAILQELGITATPEGLISRAEALKVARRFEMLYSVGTIEQTISILGDVGFFDKSSFFKRTSGVAGPKKFANTSDRINNYLNDKYQREDGKLADGKFNVIVNSDIKGSISTGMFLEYAEGSVSPEVLAAMMEYFQLSPEQGKTISLEKYLEDRVGTSVLAKRSIKNARMLLDFLSFVEADAQGYIIMDEYMEFMERVGDVTPTMRQAYAKVQQGIKLSKEEQAVFTPLKPQYYGPSSNSEIFSPIFLKLSLLPIYPQLFETTNPNGAIANMYKDMQSSKQVGISVFESGVKIGRAVDENGNSNPFYNENGEYSPIQEGLIQELDYEYFGIQVEMGEKIKDKQVKGSQQRALLAANAYEAGRIVPGKENIVRNDLELSALENETNNTNFKYLTDELGITEDADGNFIIEDKGISMLASLLRDEAVRREMDDSYLVGIDKFLESDTKVLDTLGNKSKIENLLYSLVSNRVVRSKIHGGAKVQVASTGFEQGTRSFVDIPAVYQDKHKFSSNVGALGFYRRGPKGSKTIAMQVMLPHYFKELIGGDVTVRNGIIYRDGVEIGGKELLEIYGFRIPTSALNSIDAIEVVGFLPQEAGDAIMIPSESVVKAGSDYDIDKLTLYFPNYVWNKRENRLSKIDYLTNENSTVQERVEALKRLDPKKYSLIADQLGVEGVKDQFITLAKNLRKYKKQLFKNASSDEIKAIKTLEAQRANLKPNEKGGEKIDFILGILGADIFKDVESIDDATQELKESIREHEEILESFNTQIIEKLIADNAKENPSISIENQNAQKAIDNRIIELSREIVLDPTNFDQLIRPVSAFRLKEIAATINKVRGVSNTTPEFSDLLNFENVLSMAKRFWGGKAGLGMAAVANTHQIKAQKSGLGLILTEARVKALSKFTTLSNRTSEDGSLFIPLGNIYDVNGENLISEIVGEFITAFVDVAKDPFVFDINANIATFTSYIGMLRLGVPLDVAARFISQRSIVEFAEEVQNNPGSTPFQIAKYITEEYLDLAKMYGGDVSIANQLMASHNQNTLESVLDMDSSIKLLEENLQAGLSQEDALASAGVTSQDATTYYTAQGLLMSDFDSFRIQIASPINKISAIKSDRSSGTARSRAHSRLMVKEQEALWLSGNYINLDRYVGEDSYMNSFNDVQEKGSRLFNSVFISDRLPGGAAIVDKLIQRAVDSPLPFDDKLKYVDLVENHFVAYLLSTIPGADGKAMHQDAVRLMQGKGKDIPSLPRRIKALQKSLAREGESSLILDELFPILETGDISSSEFRTEGIKKFSKRLATFDKNVLIEDMKILLDSDPELAEDLVKFTILQSGTMTSPIAFTDLVPAENMFRILEPILKNYLDSDYTIDVQSFEDQFVQNIFMNPVATENYQSQYVAPNSAEANNGRSQQLAPDEVRVVVNANKGPYALKPMRHTVPPPMYITVSGISSSRRAKGAYSAEEKAELKSKGKLVTLTRVFKLAPDVMEKWVKIQTIKADMASQGKEFDYLKHTTVALRRAEWNEMPRRGDGMRFTEYGPKNSLSIIGENNILLDKKTSTTEFVNDELIERLQSEPVKVGNILEMNGTPIIPVAAEGTPAASDLARQANEKGLLSETNRLEPFVATTDVVSAMIKNNFADPVNDAMFIAAIANIQSLAEKSPAAQILMPPIGLGINDGNNAAQIEAKVELLSNLANNNDNITLVINDSPLIVEQAHNAILRDMFNCK